MGWEIDIPKYLRNLKGEIVELESLRDGKITMGDSFYKCKKCNLFFRKVVNDYAKKGYCSDCWKKMKEEKLKQEWLPLVGAKILDFKIEVDEFGSSEPRLGELLLEKTDGSKHLLKAAKIQHFIL